MGPEKKRRYRRILLYSKQRIRSGVLRPVARCQGLLGQSTFVGGQDFYFHYLFKTSFPGHNTILGELPLNAPPP